MHRNKLNEIIGLVTSILQEKGLGYRCIEAEWNQHDRILRLFIDRPIGEELPKIVMDDCVAATKALNQVEQIDELVNGAFNMEISSPGVERPIRLVEDFKALVGEQVEVRVNEPVEGKRKVEGELIVCDSSQGKFGVNINGDETWEFGIENLLKAHVIYDWSK
jgi:ribosome maturation factor RimP